MMGCIGFEYQYELACKSEPLWHQTLFGCGCGFHVIPVIGTTLIALLITALVFIIYSWNINKNSGAK
jgi:hypothetical protein